MKLFSLLLYHTLFVESQEWYCPSFTNALLQLVMPSMFRLFLGISSMFLLIEVAAITLFPLFNMQKLFVCRFIRTFDTISPDSVRYCRLFREFFLSSQKSVKSPLFKFNNFSANSLVLDDQLPFSQ